MQSKAEFGNQSHRLAAPVQFFLGKPIFQCFGNLLIVPLRKREVRISVNADIERTDYFRIATVTVDRGGKEFGHFRSRAPVVVVRMRGLRLRNVVAVEDHDGKVRELQGSIHRHFFGFHVPEKAGVRAHFLPISAFDGIFMLPRKTDLSFGLSWIKTEFCLL